MKIFYIPIYSLVILFAYSYWFGLLPLLAPLIYLLASAFSFYLYYKDKRAAQSGDWRVPESTLHLSSLVCGWPGSILGQQLLRHKTKKLTFLSSFWTMFAINVAGLAYLHSGHGSRMLHKHIYNFEYWAVSEFGSNVWIDILLQLTNFRIHN